MDDLKTINSILFYVSRKDLDTASELFLNLARDNPDNIKEIISKNEKLVDLAILNIKQLHLEDIFPDQYKNDIKIFISLLNDKNVESFYDELSFFNNDIINSYKEEMLNKINNWKYIGSFPVLYKDKNFMEKIFNKELAFDICFFDRKTINDLPKDIIKLIFNKCPSDDMGKVSFFDKLPSNMKKDFEVQKMFLYSLPNDMDVFPQFKDLIVDVKYPCLVKNIKKVVEKPIEERKSLEDNIPKTDKSKKTRV